MQRQQARADMGKFVIKDWRMRLDGYFALTVRNVRDSIPKAIGFFLVRALEQHMQYELFTALTDKS